MTGAFYSKSSVFVSRCAESHLEDILCTAQKIPLSSGIQILLLIIFYAEILILQLEISYCENQMKNEFFLNFF